MISGSSRRQKRYRKFSESSSTTKLFDIGAPVMIELRSFGILRDKIDPFLPFHDQFDFTLWNIS